MDGRRALVTGATRGIGLETAVRLAGLGADVLVHGRDDARGAAALAVVRAASSAAASPALYTADLSTRAGVRGLAAAVLDDGPRLDVLVANAGVYAPERVETADGVELTFAVNVACPPAAGGRAPAGTPRGGTGARRRRELGLALDRRAALGRPAAGRPRGLRCSAGVRPVQAGRADADAGARPPPRGQRRHGGLPRPGPWPPAMLAAGCLGELPGISVEDGAVTSVYLASAPEAAGLSGAYFEDARRRDAAGGGARRPGAGAPVGRGRGAHGPSPALTCVTAGYSSRRIRSWRTT